MSEFSDLVEMLRRLDRWELDAFRSRSIGRSVQDISANRNVKPRVVEFLLGNVYDKLGLTHLKSNERHDALVVLAIALELATQEHHIRLPNEQNLSSSPAPEMPSQRAQAEVRNDDRSGVWERASRAVRDSSSDYQAEAARNYSGYQHNSEGQSRNKQSSQTGSSGPHTGPKSSTQSSQSSSGGQARSRSASGSSQRANPKTDFRQARPEREYDKLIAAMSYIIVFLIPILVLASSMNERRYIKIHAYQGLVFGILSVVLFILVGLCSMFVSIFFFLFGLLVGMLWLLPFPLAIYFAYLVYAKDAIELPLVTDLTKSVFKDL